MSKYIVFDGMDGSGKGTQMKLLEKKFGNSIIFTREPGGTPFAEEIRRVVRDNVLASESTALNNFLLFLASREELQHNLVAPTLKSGKHVFSDRGDSSTYAFQLCGEEHEELTHLFNLSREHIFLNRQSPDLYIVFDLPAEMSRRRALQDVARKTNHFDVRDLGFYERVRKGFRKFAVHMPVKFVDATRTPEEIHQEVLELLAEEGIGLSG